MVEVLHCLKMITALSAYLRRLRQLHLLIVTVTREITCVRLLRMYWLVMGWRVNLIMWPELGRYSLSWLLCL
jgi:hypothetical protein